MTETALAADLYSQTAIVHSATYALTGAVQTDYGTLSRPSGWNEGNTDWWSGIAPVAPVVLERLDCPPPLLVPRLRSEQARLELVERGRAPILPPPPPRRPIRNRAARLPCYRNR